MEAVGALNPADTFEAVLAVEAVTAKAYARDSLRLASEHRDDFKLTLRCRAQAGAMMRQGTQTLRMLREMQAARLAAAPVFAVGTRQSPRPAAAQPDRTEGAAHDPAPATSAPQPDQTQAAAQDPAPAPQSDAFARAEAFALEEPVAAAQIRFDRGLTSANKALIFNPALIPSDPTVIEALINGAGEVPGMLDDVGDERAAAD
jgi:hypothetical protein